MKLRNVSLGAFIAGTLFALYLVHLARKAKPITSANPLPDDFLP